MKRAMILGTALTGFGMATAAYAAEHDILILPDTYFPETTYLDPGDSVKFINLSADQHTIIAANDAWTIGPIEPDGEYTLIVDHEIERTFHNANVFNSDGSYAVTGDISFDEAPID